MFEVAHLFFLFSKFLALTLSFLLTRSCLYRVNPPSDILTWCCHTQAELAMTTSPSTREPVLTMTMGR